MNLILVGLSGRDQMAFDLFLKRSMPSWHWRSVSAIKGQSLPAADVLIVDLTACGWSQRSDDNYAALKQVVGDCVAVLLVSGQERPGHGRLAGLAPAGRPAGTVARSRRTGPAACPRRRAGGEARRPGLTRLHPPRT